MSAMAHPTAYLPDGLLGKVAEVEFLGKLLVTPEGGKLTSIGISAYWALVTTVIFAIVYKLSRYYTPLYFKGYRNMSTHDQRDWDTRLGNILYSAYIVFWAARLIMVDDLFWQPGSVPLMKRTSADSYAAIGVSVGFFVSELFITLKYWMGGTAMVVHHTGSLMSVLLAALVGDGHCPTLWMLSTEFTTPFIAFRYMLEKAGFKSHPLYIINGLAILAGWTVARLATFPPFFVTIWRFRDQIRLMNPLSQFLLLVFPITLAALNAFWYTKIVRGAIKVLGPKRTPPDAKKAD